MSAEPAGIERDYPLARLTTVRTGGPADYFARAPRRYGLAIRLVEQAFTGR